MREIAIYRQSLDESSAMEFNDALARFGIENFYLTLLFRLGAAWV